jgi:hypothetical protein
VRPLNLGETLDAAIKIVRARWRALATVVLVVGVPLQVATVVLALTTIDDYEVGSGLLTPAADAGDDSAALAGSTAILVLMVLGYLFATVACYRLVADDVLGRSAAGPGEALRFAAERLGATLWLGIVLFAGLAVGFFAFVVPGIWLAVAWSVAFPAMLVEGTAGLPALQRSMRLVQGRWWATCGRLAVAVILITVAGAVVGSVLVAPVDSGSTAALLLEALGNLVVSVFATPFLAAVAMVIYFDLRARKEGWTGNGPAAPVADASATAYDAFGHPVAPRPEPGPTAAPGPAPAPAPPPSAAPGRPGDVGPEDAAPEGWAPPVAPEPRPRSLWDPGPDPDA